MLIFVFFDFNQKITKQTRGIDRIISDKSHTLKTVKIQTLGGPSRNNYVIHMRKKRISIWKQ